MITFNKYLYSFCYLSAMVLVLINVPFERKCKNDNDLKIKRFNLRLNNFAILMLWSIPLIWKANESNGNKNFLMLVAIFYSSMMYDSFKDVLEIKGESLSCLNNIFLNKLEKILILIAVFSIAIRIFIQLQFNIKIRTVLIISLLVIHEALIFLAKTVLKKC